MSSETTRTITNPVGDTIRFINRLQQAAVPTNTGTSRYNTLVLGETSKANTRPFILYLPNGEPFKLLSVFDSSLQATQMFRVEAVNENSATIRALAYRSQSSVNFSERLDQDIIDSDGFKRLNNRYTIDEYNQTTFNSASLIATRSLCTVDLNAFIAIQCLDDIYVQLDSDNV